ncbi:NUDIX hydrolase [Prescottella sp. R16]|uniref:NUDIX hydrolase n=1 Tax=Prescottella sp. R16 TaxID=3064529 RepID=UPI00272E1B70|nr:NUDIX hydrolase [Prescottella sp. R16]
MRGDGDGWATTPDGVRHWGRHGAAGLLLRAPLPDGSAAVLLQHRAEWSHQGGTWALPGGARDSHETTVHAAVREAQEETGIDVDAIRVRAERVTSVVAGGWTYTTVVADSEKILSLVPNGESTELRWVREAEVTDLPLHPGFADAWPGLRTCEVQVLLDAGTAELLDRFAQALPRTVELPGGGFCWLPRIEVIREAQARGTGIAAGVRVPGPVPTLTLTPSTVREWLG